MMPLASSAGGKMVLTYFDLYARAEPIRLLLAHSKCDWIDQRLSGEDFKRFKAENDHTGGLPVLQMDGKMFT
jgi:hypothetical protein